jgi:hypothetical protein
MIATTQLKNLSPSRIHFKEVQIETQFHLLFHKEAKLSLCLIN